MTVWRMLLIGAALVAPWASIDAQIRSVVPMPRDTVKPRPDPARPDTLRPDSAGTRELVRWNETDSVMQALMARPGYSGTRYQGNRVVFDAETRTLDLDGDRAAIGRDQTLLVADSITYNDST